MIIVINGPPGVGKTRTGWCLVESLRRAALVDIDYVAAVKPFNHQLETDREYAYDSAAILAAHHLQHGYDVVVTWVFEDETQLRAIRERLSAFGPFHAFRLTCSIAELERRIRRRHSEEIEPEEARGRELHEMLERSGRGGDIGLRVETDDRTPNEVAAAILRHVSGVLGTDESWNDPFTATASSDEPVTIAPYDPAWPMRFDEEAAVLERALAPWLVGQIEHIGSTAVPGLAAKPVIDILAGVDSLEASRPAIEAATGLGYCYAPYRADQEHWFCKPSPAHRTHHLHLVPLGSPQWIHAIAFRDYLRSHSETARDYAELKQRLALEHHFNRDAYTDAKREFIDSVVELALQSTSGLPAT